ncbi:MAG TPA: hypothetical protein VFQ61_24640, partial [Polyangiaceae bacterium]|nr:hypothetical protein [Polyangiaceae bacterium]
YGFHATEWPGPLSWTEVKEQLSREDHCQRTPFLFTWEWAEGGSHMMVAKGYSSVKGKNYIEILDPWAPCQGDEGIVDYASFASEPGSHTHSLDFYDIEYVGFGS